MLSNTGSDSSLSPLQLHYLRRLNRLLRLRADQRGLLNEEGARLIDRAIYSTYTDAVDLGVTAEAKKLLQKHAVSLSGKPAQ